MKATLVAMAAAATCNPPRRRPRYLLLAGPVRSATDGQWHHVGASVLAFLYGVPMADCIVMPPQTPANHRERMGLFERVRTGELIGLTPRFDGDYRLPAARVAALSEPAP
jgi:hypothetical protein